MLDAYISGNAGRISPEAPVPVVAVAQRRYVPGGAANVASNVRSLGARVTLAGVTGVDEAAHRLRGELAKSGVDEALVEDISRPTTLKTRVTATGQQIVRFDDEDRSPLPDSVAKQLQQKCVEALRESHVCVLSDYAKGVASEPFCRFLIDEAIRQGKPVVVDPKSRDMARYRGATVIAPNTKEAGEAAGITIHGFADLEAAARLLLDRVSPSALLVTRSEEGMSLFRTEGGVQHLPALVNEVADVTGAGDTVVAALAIGLALGFPLADAAAIANLAASVAVSHHGTWAVRPAQMEAVSGRLTLADA